MCKYLILCKYLNFPILNKYSYRNISVNKILIGLKIVDSMANETKNIESESDGEIGMAWRNLAPTLERQRVIIEGTTIRIVEPDTIGKYFSELALDLEMQVLSGPFAYSAHEMGFGGWIHWKTSRAHFYSYPTLPSLFTVDIYTCKPFEVERAVDFTKSSLNSLEIVWKEVKV